MLYVMWQKHYEAILNSSLDQSSETYVSNRLNCINEMDTFERITHHDILAAVKSLKRERPMGMMVSVESTLNILVIS